MTNRLTVEQALSARYAMLFVAALSAFMVSSAGVAIVPSVAQIAAPLVCSGDHLVTKTTTYSRGRRSGIQTSVSCVDATGKSTSVNAFLIMFAITFELFIPFTVIGWLVCSRMWPMPKPELDDEKDEDVED